MRFALPFLLAAFAGFSSSQGFAQGSDGAAVAPSPQPARTRPSRRVTCWRQAGITPDLVNQRWKIEDQAKLRIAAACNEETTSAQQKRNKIEQIHQETQQAISQLIPAKQLEAFNSCEAEQDKKHPKPAEARELGPCGGVIPKTDSATPGMDHSAHH